MYVEVKFLRFSQILYGRERKSSKSSAEIPWPLDTSTVFNISAFFFFLCSKQRVYLRSHFGEYLFILICMSWKRTLKFQTFPRLIFMTLWIRFLSLDFKGKSLYCFLFLLSEMYRAWIVKIWLKFLEVCFDC